jgi:branched-chain amino acid transport system substrate-binding protein
MRSDILVVMGLLATAVTGAGAARAQISDDIVRIGVLNDQSNVYADLGGPGSVIAARMAIEDVGGKVLGKPIDMLVADHQSKADVGASIARQWFDSDKVDLVIGFDNSSVALGDMTNSIKQANEFGLANAGQTIVSLLTFITDVNSVGLKAAQGLTFVTAFYWDRDDESRAWSKRFFELHKRMPTMAQAAIYSAIRHYVRAIEAAGTDEAKAVMAKMRELPVNDFYARNGHVREDGRMVHEMYLFEVKKPSESKGRWDDYNLLGTVPNSL